MEDFINSHQFFRNFNAHTSLYVPHFIILIFNNDIAEICAYLMKTLQQIVHFSLTSAILYPWVASVNVGSTRECTNFDDALTGTQSHDVTNTCVEAIFDPEMFT
jgi:hypothetical protein